MLRGQQLLDRQLYGAGRATAREVMRDVGARAVRLRGDVVVRNAERVASLVERRALALQLLRLGFPWQGVLCHGAQRSESFTESQVINSPGRKSGHKEDVPWGEAVDVAGSEERLKRMAATKNTWAYWKNTKKAVPAYVVLRLLKENLRLQGAAPSPSDPVPLLKAMERVRQYWGTKRWEKFDLALALVGQPHRATDPTTDLPK